MSTTEYDITGMTCAACATRLEKALRELPATQAHVNFATERVRIHWQEKVDEVLLRRLAQHSGFGLRLVQASSPDEQNSALQQQRLIRLSLMVATMLTVPLLLTMVGLVLPIWWHALSAAIVVFVCGAAQWQSAYYSLRQRLANMEVLICLGAGLAWGLSLWAWQQQSAALYFETSAAIILFALVGRWLESRARYHALFDLDQLRLSLVTSVPVWREGKWQSIPLSDIQIGDQVEISAYQQIVVDGIVHSGRSEVNESLLSGESVPVVKAPGDRVYASCMNGAGALRITVQAVTSDTVVAGIVRLVSTALQHKAPSQALIDRVTQYFVPTIVVVALFTALGWLTVGSGVFQGEFEWHRLLANEAWQNALWHSITVLVIACPCALGLATPTALLVATGRAAQRGIVLRDAGVFEQLQQIKAIAIDKTGTLTQAQVVVVAAGLLNRDGTLVPMAVPEPGDLSPIALNLNRTTDPTPQAADEAQWLNCLATVSLIERNVVHPLAQALINYAQTYPLKVNDANLQSSEVVAGQGIRARIHDASGVPTDYLLGRPAWITQQCPDLQPLEILQANSVQWAQIEHSTLIILAALPVDGKPALCAYFACHDPLRVDAAAELQRWSDQGLKLYLLSGDRAQVCTQLTQHLPFVARFAELSPRQKQKKIAALQVEHGAVLMIGDGINDAPALAQADIGIAVANATDVAQASSDVTLLRSDLTRVSRLFKLAQATRSTVRQNLLFAFGYNVILLPLAIIGVMSPIAASFAMACSSVSVILNSLRLKWRRIENE